MNGEVLESSLLSRISHLVLTVGEDSGGAAGELAESGNILCELLHLSVQRDWNLC